jgi:hypothetical protein
VDFESSSPRFDREATQAATSQSAASSAGSVLPVKLTFSDVLKDVERLDCFASSRATLRTALRQTAWSVAFIDARVTGTYLDEDRKKLELARMSFDIAVVNQLWQGLSYRLAGFTSEKAYRNGRWGLRRICRTLGMVVPHRAPQLPPNDPCAPLLAVATSFKLATVRRFAAYLADQGLRPEAVTTPISIAMPISCGPNWSARRSLPCFGGSSGSGAEPARIIRTGRRLRSPRRAGPGRSTRRSQPTPPWCRTKSKRSGAG